MPLTPEQEAIALNSVIKFNDRALNISGSIDDSPVLSLLCSIISDAIASAAEPAQRSLGECHKLCVHYETKYKEYRDELAAVNQAAVNMAREADCETKSLEKRLQAQSKDTARLDWLEWAAWNHEDSGNGIAIFPFRITADATTGITLHGLGDEDGSNLGDELTGSQDNLRAAIDGARKEVEAA